MSTANVGAPTSSSTVVRQPSPLTRGFQKAALGSLDLVLGRGGDVFDRSTPTNPLLRNGVLGCLGKGLAVGAGVMGTGLFVGMHVITHPLSCTRYSIMRSGEMGAMTLGGMGYCGINGAFGALLGAARTPVSYLRTKVEQGR